MAVGGWHRTRQRCAGICLIALLLGLLPAVAVPAVAGPSLPAGFNDTLVTALARPTALAFTPDGRLLIGAQPGRLYVVAEGGTAPTVALDLGSRVCANSERGLLGVAVDPYFASTGHIYVFYTYNKTGTCATKTLNGPVNRVSRFKLSSDNRVALSSEKVLLDNVLSPAGSHNAGDLQVGKDNLLYVSIGDGGCDYAELTSCAGENDAARDDHVLLGKVARVTRSGGIPAGNPYQGDGTARCNLTGRTQDGNHCQETYASGLRNPFRMAADPNAADTRIFVNDVGQNEWEEIDDLQSGADYGWNLREGPCANGSTTDCGPAAGLRNPIHAYSHDDGCESITGGAFVPDGVWPAEFEGSYVFGDFVCGTIFRLSPVAGGGWTQTPFVTGLGASSAVAMTFGPAGGGQALYYTSYAGGGEVRRITYSSVNSPPQAELSVSPAAGPAPLQVTLDGSASRDPDGDPVTYEWAFGDGDTASTTSPTTSHTYAYGSYTATLRLRDRHGAVSDPAGVTIDAGNTPPAPTIDTPLPSETFAVGQEIRMTGHAEDEQDGDLPPSALSWEVLRHHGGHSHPWVSPTTGAQVDFTAPPPEDLTATTASHLELRLTATDSSGRSATVSQELHPRLVDVAFTTQPAGLRLGVNERSLTGPSTVTSWQDFALSVSAATQTDSAGRRWAFNRWSDGGQASHQIITGGSAATYTATFTEIGNGLRGSYYDAQDFSALATTRTDATVNFDWKHGAPAAGMGADTFSVHWTGSVKPRYSERYTFTVASDEGARLWVDGQQIIDDFSPHTLRSRSGSITLTAGRRYPVRLDYYDRSGVAAAKLQWSSSRQARQVVPRSQLFPPS